jgi:hypothetical protein
MGAAPDESNPWQVADVNKIAANIKGVEFGSDWQYYYTYVKFADGTVERAKEPVKHFYTGGEQVDEPGCDLPPVQIRN